MPLPYTRGLADDYVQQQSFAAVSGTESRFEYEDFSFHQYAAIGELVDRIVRERLESILSERFVPQFKSISNQEAKKEISAFLSEKHRDGYYELSVLDIAQALKLPPVQIEQIMDGFVRTRKIQRM